MGARIGTDYRKGCLATHPLLYRHASTNSTILDQRFTWKLRKETQGRELTRRYQESWGWQNWSLGHRGTWGEEKSGRETPVRASLIVTSDQYKHVGITCVPEERKSATRIKKDSPLCTGLDKRESFCRKYFDFLRHVRHPERRSKNHQLGLRRKRQWQSDQANDRAEGLCSPPRQVRGHWAPKVKCI